MVRCARAAARHLLIPRRVDLRARCALLRKITGEVGERVAGSQDAHRRRLRDRLARLLGDADVTVDPARIEVEIVMIAERSDIAEEVTRLCSHLDQFCAALGSAPGEPVGRRLDFLLQEMLREANTLGAKAQDALVSQHVVTMKVELERLSAENERWAARLTVLKEMVEHHVEEEEGEMFNKARKLFDREQERELGTAFLEQKKLVLAELRKG